MAKRGAPRGNKNAKGRRSGAFGGFTMEQGREIDRYHRDVYTRKVASASYGKNIAKRAVGFGMAGALIGSSANPLITAMGAAGGVTSGIISGIEGTKKARKYVKNNPKPAPVPSAYKKRKKRKRK